MEFIVAGVVIFDFIIQNGDKMAQLSFLQEQNKDEKDVEGGDFKKGVKNKKTTDPMYVMIAKRFRLSRDLSSLTEKEAIKTMGLTNPKVISQIENCHRLPTIKQLAAARNAYGVNCDYLLGFTDDDDPTSTIPTVSAIFNQNQKVLNMIGNVLAKTSYSYARVVGDQTIKDLVDKISVLNEKYKRFKELNPDFEDMRGGASFENCMLGILPLARSVKKRIEEKEKLIELHNEQLEHILQRKLALEGV